jgi:hypothetical protein
MFLDPSSATFPHHPNPPQRRRRRLGFGIGVFFVLFLLASGYVAVAATRMVHGAMTMRDSLFDAKTAIASAEFSVALSDLSVAREGIDACRTGIEMLAWAEYVPWIGSRYRASVGMIDATRNTIDVVSDAVSIAADVYRVIEDARATLAWKDPSIAQVPIHDLPTSVKRELFVRLADALPALQSMQVKLALAEEDIVEFQAIPETQVVADFIIPFAQVVSDLKASVDFLVPFAGITREFTGLRGDRQFLLMFMNDTELRPTGGFLGSYGLLLIRDGDMKQLTTDDAYAIDVPAAQSGAYVIASPEPIVTYLEQPVWYFRDGTWSPDFATGAQETVSLFRQEIAAAGDPIPQIDGVIGLTTGFLEQLLEFIGPVTVNGVIYTAESAADVLEYQVEVAFEERGIPLEDRKDVVGELTNVILDRLLEVSPSRFADVFMLLSSAFVHKDMALYSTDIQTQAIIEDAAWAGAVNTERADDVVMVVDANMASLKSDPVVQRSIAYSIAPYGNEYRATLAITYDHKGSFDWKTSRYRTYTRVYVPEGSALVSVDGSLKNDAIRNPSGAPGDVTTTHEFGLTSFGTFTSIEPGQSRTLTFVYTLPETVKQAIARGAYDLRFLKQIGADPRELHLNLDFNRTLRGASPAELESQWGDDMYRVDAVLDRDQDFWVEL